MTIKEEIWHTDPNSEEQVIEVELHANIYWENDSFYYEYGNICATHKLDSYPVIHEYKWNQHFYSRDENKIILDYIEKNKKQIFDLFWAEYIK
jgi:hypothetical protein